MAWREVSVNGKEYGRFFADVFYHILHDLKDKKKNEVYIPLENGRFLGTENEFCDLELSLTIDEPAIDVQEKILKETLEFFQEAYHHTNWDLTLLIGKTLSYENKPLTYRMRVDYNPSIGHESYVTYVLPPQLSTKHNFKIIDKQAYVDGIDLKDHQMLLQAAEEAEKQGFKTVIKDLPYLKQVFIEPKELELDEVIKLWKKNEFASFEASSFKQKKHKNEEIQNLSMDMNSEIFELNVERIEGDSKSFADFCNFVGDVIHRLDLKIDAEGEVTYDEAYETSISKGAKKLLSEGAGPMMNKIIYVALTPLWYGVDYIAKKIENKIKSERKKEKIIEDTLKEEAPEGGYIQLDVDKILKEKK